MHQYVHECSGLGPVEFYTLGGVVNVWLVARMEAPRILSIIVWVPALCISISLVGTRLQTID